MLKTSLLAAAAAFVTVAAMPVASYAQDLGTRQIVVDPSGGGGNGGGAGNGSGGGTGGGGQNGSGGGLKKPAIIAPVAAVPTGADAGAAPAGAGAASATGGAPVAAINANPAGGQPDALDAIVGAPAGGNTATLDAVAPGQPAAPAVAPAGPAAPDGANPPAAAAAGPPAPAGANPAGAAAAVALAPAAAAASIKSVDGLIGALQTGGFKVDLDHRAQNGDYYLLVTSPKDQSFGYLLTVDANTGKVLVKEKVDPADYGYDAATPDYGKPKGYDQPADQQSDDYSNDNSYGGGNSYGDDSGSYGSGNSKY